MSLLKWAAIMAILAIIAAIFGFTNLAAGFADIARVLFFLFLVGMALLFALGVFVYNKVT
jgi:uncharacterized membrane protein YtjA (UPF0391 family)